VGVAAPTAAGVLRPSIGPVAVLVVLTFAVSAATLLLAGGIPSGPERPQAFAYLLSRNEPAAAWLSCGLILLAAVASRLFPRACENVLVLRLAADPRPFVAAMTLSLAAAAVLVYRAHPLAMDEYAPVFQAHAFARFSLSGKVPPELVPRIAPPSQFWFIQARPSGELISSYWPGFALLLTPFVWLRVPWLLNPLLGGATLLVLWRLVRKLWPETPAPGWAVLLAASSPAFVVNSISFYSMSAHLLAALAFAGLMLEKRHVAAGAVGSLALVLHNPLPHALYALPWIAWAALRPEGVRNLARLAFGYLPGSLVLGLGWFLFRTGFQPAATGGPGGLSGLSASLARVAFAPPSLELLWSRSVNVAELALWAVPALLPLSCIGAWARRNEVGPRLIALSALSVFVGYLFVPFDQGHGWGFRYFHVAWGALPLLGAAALVSPVAERPPMRGLMLFAALANLVAGNLLRCAQVRSFIDAHLAQIPAPPERSRLEIVMVHVHSGYYTIDLVQNDPFLEGSRWVLMSRGLDDDRHFIQQAFPKARLAASSETATVWQVE
jgi:hypothetical protein